MLNWIAVLSRIMSLYNVKTQSDLTMALGMPVNVGMEENPGDASVPWPLLEIVVAEKKVSWDWLLTGCQFGEGEDAKQSPAPDHAEGEKPPTDASAASEQPGKLPRIELGELERKLLSNDGAKAKADAAPNFEPEGQAQYAYPDSVVRELEDIRSSIQREIERVNRLLEEHGGRR